MRTTTVAMRAAAWIVVETSESRAQGSADRVAADVSARQGAASEAPLLVPAPNLAAGMGRRAKRGCCERMRPARLADARTTHAVRWVTRRVGRPLFWTWRNLSISTGALVSPYETWDPGRRALLAGRLGPPHWPSPGRRDHELVVGER